MKPSFDSFVTSFPTNKVIQHSSTAKHIYDEIIWDDDVRIKFVEASENGRPALSACAKQVEDYCLNDPTCDLDLSNDTVKQTIGRMVKTAMLPFGYTTKNKSRLSLELNLQFFVTAMNYEYTGGETQKVVKQIVDC